MAPCKPQFIFKRSRELSRNANMMLALLKPNIRDSCHLDHFGEGGGNLTSRRDEMELRLALPSFAFLHSLYGPRIPAVSTQCPRKACGTCSQTLPKGFRRLALFDSGCLMLSEAKLTSFPCKKQERNSLQKYVMRSEAVQRNLAFQNTPHKTQVHGTHFVLTYSFGKLRFLPESFVSSGNHLAT